MVNILICDDEISYQEILKCKIQKILNDKIGITSQIMLSNSIEDMENILISQNIDIVFLDIMIGEKNSLDWLINITDINKNRSQFIVMTSFPLESYNLSETEHCYFLIKPKMTNEQLQKALVKAINYVTKRNEDKKIIKIGSKNYTIDIQNILYIETYNNNITVHMIDGTSYSIYSTLKAFSDMLSPNFLRCHKCYMVNMNHIKSYQPHKFYIGENDSVPIPPKKYQSIILEYKNYLLNL